MSVTPSRTLSRRAAMAVGVGGVLGGLVSCGGSPSKSGAAAASGKTRAAAFSAEITHRFGTTTFDHRPERVVALGGGDMETAIALGVVPVAGADWFGFLQTRSWVEDALGKSKPPELIAAQELDFEQVVAFRPDLILYVNSRNEEAVYTKLAQIAPTIASGADVKNAYGVSWQDQLATIARATGTVDRGKRVRAATEKLISDARAARPQFAGKTITAGVYTSGAFSVWLPSDPRMQLLQQLGFKTNARISAYDRGDFFVSLSEERLREMESDVIFLAALDAQGEVVPEVASNEVFQSLSTVRDGHVVYWPGPATINTNSAGGAFASAFSIGGPLGITYSLRRLVPLLDKGLGNGA